MLSHEEMVQAGLAALQRRALLRRTGMGLAGTAAAIALANATGAIGSAEAATEIIPPTSAPTAMDINILNFALNLEYLDSSFYHFALLGTPLSAADRSSGTGVVGPVPNYTGASPVSFQTPVVQQLAQDFAADEQAHVEFLHSASALGSSAVAIPLLDLSVGPTSAFSVVAANAGYIQFGQTFNPYANENEFLVGAYIFEDVAVTAYAGSAALLSQGSELVQYAASLMSIEAYHAASIRTLLAIRGGGAATDGIANVRSILSSGGFPAGSPQGDDFGTLDPVSGDVVLAPTDANALAYRRSVQQILHIVYGNTNGDPGLFFPQGLNTLPGVTGFS